ncbi:MAG: GNAT family N-acetyltransferase, partial [Gammaproteobacteria bacterium]|nr:GNAT family N-acetyltransferase [Gammaproteobacteria bacterium]
NQNSMSLIEQYGSHKIRAAQKVPSGSILFYRLLKKLIEYQCLSVYQNNILYSPEIYSENNITQSPEADRYSQQKTVIEQIIRVAKGHANRPLVLTANRGRGKSAALGLACANMIESDKQIDKQIIVTAPLKTNLEVFYYHLLQQTEHLLTADKTKSNQLCYQSGSRITYMPIDEIILKQPACHLLIIDEAAAIPTQQLEKVSQIYNRLVFSTTVHGYEGNGKGFEIRFKKRLLSIKPQTRFASMTHPIRWSELDQLEKASFDALLLNCELTEVKTASKLLDKNKVRFELVDKKLLLCDEDKLKTIFSLLVNAHYQTRPNDLKRLLEDKNVSLFVAIINKQIVGVCMLNREGNLNSDDINAIYQSKKRLKGELLPQSIIAHSGFKQAGKLTFQRVVRIAVHPALQNLQIGSWLLTEVESYCHNNKTDFIGTSFAVSEDVLHFWLKNQFSSIRFATSKDSATGAHTIEMCKPLNKDSEALLKTLTKRFNQAFLYKLKGELQNLDNPSILAIVRHQLNDNPHEITDYDSAELHAFCEQQRSLSMIEDILILTTTNYLIDLVLKNDKITDTSTIEFAIDWSLKQFDKNALIEKHKLTGKKALDEQFRNLTRQILLISSNKR